MTRAPLPTDDLALVARCQAGDRAAGDALLRAHERRLYWATRHYRNRGVDLDDLMQEARVAFMRAVDQYDPEVGASLDSYAAFKIRRTMGDAMAEGSYPYAISKLDYRAMVQARREGDPLPDWSRPVARLDAPIGDDGPALVERIGTQDEAADVTLARHEEATALREVIATLPDRLAEVVRRRLDGETLEEIGASWGSTRENARQFEVKAHRMLRHRMRAREGS